MELKDLFPLPGQVTQKIIDGASIWNTKDCIGARTLREALSKTEIYPQIYGILWGVFEAEVYFNSGDSIYITTEEKVDMMEVSSPQKVTFIISDL